MPKRVLIVDDDAATCFMLSTMLTEAGYGVITATTLPAAQSALANEAPDALIVDVRLGGHNGLHLVATNPRPIPVIVITGYSDAGLRYEAGQMGAEYLLKPVQPDTLLGLLNKKLTPA